MPFVAAFSLALALFSAQEREPAQFPRPPERGVLIGRLLDWRGEPLRDAELWAIVGASMESSQGGSFQARSWSTGAPLLATDSEGRFRYQLSMTRHGMPWQLYVVYCREGGGWTCPGAQRAQINVEGAFGRPSTDLGEVRLSLGVRDRLRADPPATDDEVVVMYRELHANLGQHESPDTRARDLLWNEMARRGGERWIKFLRDELAAAEASRRLLSENPVGLWSALRRAERLPAPFTLEAVDGEPLLATFPTRPMLRVRIRNVDPEARATIQVDTTQPSMEHFFAEAWAAGRRTAMLDTAFDGGNTGNDVLGPGGAVEALVDLGRLVELDSAGELRITLHYLPTWGAGLDAEELQDRLTLASAPLVFRWRPLILARAEVDAFGVEAALAAIPPEAPAVLVRRVFSPGRSYRRATPLGEDVVFAAGYAALPGLITALDTHAHEPRRRAQILAMLYDLTGQCDPRLVDEALGPFALVPGFQGEASDTVVFGTGFIRPESQDELVRRWRDLGTLLVVGD